MKLLTLLATATAASAAALSPLTPRQDTILWPHRTYRRWVNTGAMVNDPQDQPLIVKNGNQADETTAIVSFQFDQSTAGKKCQLLFRLWADRDTTTGSKLLDVFTYNNLPEDNFEAMKMGVLERDQHAGRIRAEFVEEAEWVMQYHGWPVIDCPAGETIGIEYVGVGDEVVVQWDIGVTGPRFKVL